MLKMSKNIPTFYDAYSHPSNIDKGYEPRPSIYRDGGDFKHGMFKFTSPFYGVIFDDNNKRIETNNFEIAYSIKGNKGPVVLMLHGVPSNRKLYYPLQRRMSPFCRTICIDMLGMGESSKPQMYGDKVNKTLLNKHNLVPGKGAAQGTKPWDWINDCFYIKELMNSLFSNEKFVFIADDWGSGINSHFAARYNNLLLAFIQIDPIAFDGYPVSEIQAIGRASVIKDNDQFKMAMGGIDQTMVQIFKTMVHNPDTVWNQYSLRAIKGTYIDTDYDRTGADSLTLSLKFDAIRVLTDRSAILAPDLLLPYHKTKNPKGVDFSKITVPSLILWGSYDSMMPWAQLYRFKYALENSRVQIESIPDAGHFAATDQPDYVVESILNFLHRELGKDVLADIFLGLTGIWKGDEELLIRDLRKIVYK